MIIIEKIRLFEAFAGIGSPRMALNNLSLPYESVGISEIDKYAIKSYEAIWGEDKQFRGYIKSKYRRYSRYGFICLWLTLSGYFTSR